MTSRLHKLVIAVLLLPLLVVMVSLFLPARYHVERSLTMRAPAEKVFRLVNTLKTWPEWTSWNTGRFPDLKVSFTGPEAGVGASASWSGKKCGQCTRTIVQAEPNRAVVYHLSFQPDRFMSKGEITLNPLERALPGEEAPLVTVTWVHEGELGWSPVGRFFGLLMENMIGPDLEQNLRNLKARIEAEEEEEAMDALLP